MRRLFEDFLRHVDEVSRLLVLCISGINSISKMDKLVLEIAKLEQLQTGQTNEAKVKRAREMAQFAKGEIKDKYPFLHSLALVSVWSGLESLIDKLVVWLLKYRQSSAKKEVISKIKIPWAEYELFDDNDKYYYLVKELERSVNANVKRGVDKFETLLDVFHVAGHVDRKVKKNIYELYNVRNIIVHNASVVDASFLKACPWKKYKVGEKIKIMPRDYVRYRDAITEYMTCVVKRLVVKYGKEQPLTDKGGVPAVG